MKHRTGSLSEAIFFLSGIFLFMLPLLFGCIPTSSDLSSYLDYIYVSRIVTSNHNITVAPLAICAVKENSTSCAITIHTRNATELAMILYGETENSHVALQHVQRVQKALEAQYGILSQPKIHLLLALGSLVSSSSISHDFKNSYTLAIDSLLRVFMPVYMAIVMATAKSPPESWLEEEFSLAWMFLQNLALSTCAVLAWKMDFYGRRT